jgi:hypothetical protein
LRIVVSMFILWGVVFITGCQENSLDAEVLSTPMPVSPTQGDTEMTPSPSIPVDAGLQNLIDKAIADLAQWLSIPPTEITLVEATPVIWPDSSLGCPQPGMAYTQVQQDGLLIRLQASNQIYEYHSGGIRDPFLCVKMVKDPNPPPQIDLFNLTPPAPNSTPGTAPTPDNGIPPGEDQ